MWTGCGPGLMWTRSRWTGLWTRSHVDQVHVDRLWTRSHVDRLWTRSHVDQVHVDRLWTRSHVDQVQVVSCGLMWSRLERAALLAYSAALHPVLITGCCFLFLVALLGSCGALRGHLLLLSGVGPLLDSWSTWPRGREEDSNTLLLFLLLLPSLPLFLLQYFCSLLLIFCVELSSSVWTYDQVHYTTTQHYTTTTTQLHILGGLS